MEVTDFYFQPNCRTEKMYVHKTLQVKKKLYKKTDADKITFQTYTVTIARIKCKTHRQTKYLLHQGHANPNHAHSTSHPHVFL